MAGFEQTPCRDVECPLRAAGLARGRNVVRSAAAVGVLQSPPDIALRSGDALSPRRNRLARCFFPARHGLRESAAMAFFHRGSLVLRPNAETALVLLLLLGIALGIGGFRASRFRPAARTDLLFRHGRSPGSWADFTQAPCPSPTAGLAVLTIIEGLEGESQHSS
jgi:hypothetical protein